MSKKTLRIIMIAGLCLAAGPATRKLSNHLPRRTDR